MADTCTTIVRGGDVWHPRSNPCGKPSKGQLANGEPACGIHLRVEKNESDRKTKRAAWEARIAAVNEALGIRCFGYEIDRAVSVSLESLESLAAAGVRSEAGKDAAK